MQKYEDELKEFIEYNEIDAQDKTIKEIADGVYNLAQKDKNNAPSDDEMVMYINEVITGKRNTKVKAKDKAQRMIIYRGTGELTEHDEKRVSELEQEIKKLQEKIIKLTTKEKPNNTQAKRQTKLKETQLTLDLGI